MKTGEIFNPYGLLQGAYVPNVILRNPDLSQSAKLLYARLLQFAGRNGTCYPAIETLADEIAISKRQIIKVLQELENKGFIKREKPIGQGKLLHKTNRYYFLWHPAFHDECKIFTTEGEPEFTSDSDIEFTQRGDIKFTSYNNKEEVE